MRIIKIILAGLLAVVLLAAIGFFAFAPAYVEKSRNAVAAHDPYPVSDAARALHGQMIVGDWHADPLLWDRDLTQRAPMVRLMCQGFLKAAWRCRSLPL